jgi:hypothetical protein
MRSNKPRLISLWVSGTGIEYQADHIPLTWLLYNLHMTFIEKEM